MSEKACAAGKMALKIMGASAAAVGVVTLSAIVASGVAAGSMAAGLKIAGNTVKEILKKEEEICEE